MTDPHVKSISVVSVNVCAHSPSLLVTVYKELVPVEARGCTVEG